MPEAAIHASPFRADCRHRASVPISPSPGEMKVRLPQMVLTARADCLRLGARQGRHMLGNRILAICLALITGSIAYSASAQDCDERFSRGCQGYSRLPPPPIFPWVPFQPREIAPNPPPASPGVLVRPGQI